MNYLNAHERRIFGRFGALLSWTAALSFFLIVLGSGVRATDSGLACPDWPLCYGKVIPMFDFQIFMEWIHRAIAGCVAILMLIATAQLFRHHLLRRAFTLQIIAAVVLLAIQIVLGGLTVLKLLDPGTVSAHLTNALMFFTVLVWMATRAKALADEPELRPRYAVTPIVKRLFIISTGLLFVQIALGGLVSTNHAGLVCPDFPTCHGEWFPPTIWPLWLQMMHRFAAFIILAIAVGLGFAAARLPLGRLPRATVRFLPWLVLAQIGLGLVNIVYILPDWASVSHLGNAVLMFTLLLLSTIEVIEAGETYKSPLPVNPSAPSWRRPNSVQI